VIYERGGLVVATSFAQPKPVVMGPGFRQDDTGYLATSN
jgi:hypothetical protein